MYAIVRLIKSPENEKSTIQYYDYLSFSWKKSLSSNCRFSFQTMGKLRLKLLSKSKSIERLNRKSDVLVFLISISELGKSSSIELLKNLNHNQRTPLFILLNDGSGLPNVYEYTV